MCPLGVQHSPERGNLGSLPAETTEIMHILDRRARRMRILSLGIEGLGVGLGLT